MAHLAIAEAACLSRGLLRLDVIVSRVALAKEELGLAPIERRIEVLERAAASRP